MIPRFRTSTAFLLVMVVAVGLGWYVDRTKLVHRIEQENRPISWYGEKFDLWSPCDYLGVFDSSQYELILSEKAAFSGKTVTSSQGMGKSELRQPDLPTLQATISLLDNDDAEARLIAAKLLALYLQASSGSGNLDTDSCAVRVQFHAAGLRRVRELLKSSDARMRSAGALILGNSLYDSVTIQCLSEAFDNEADSSVKLHLAWAYWTIGSNYPRAELYLKRQADNIASGATEQRDESEPK
jgi:hypothetical protein